MTNYKITPLPDEKLNTNNDFYICHNYECTGESITILFKFYQNFPEGINAEFVNISEKENDKITETMKSRLNTRKKVYHFAFRYSDYIEIDPKQL